MQNHQTESTRGHQEIQPGDHTRNDHGSNKSTKSLKKVRKTQKLDRDRLITLLDKQGREIYDQDKITETIEELYTELDH